MNDEIYLHEQRQTLKVCSKCALICFIILAVLLVLQAGTGALLAVKAGAGMPDAPAEAGDRIIEYGAVRSLHGAFGQLSLIPAFAVLAFSILFMLNISGVESRHTRISWAQIVKAVILVLILLGLCIGGRIFGLRLARERFWLLLEPEAHAENPGISIYTFSAPAFYTFVVIHGVVLPVIAVMIMIFMWVPFSEFTFKRKKKLKLGKWAQFAVPLENTGEEKTEEAEEKPPEKKTVADWIAMQRMVDAESKSENDK